MQKHKCCVVFFLFLCGIGKIQKLQNSDHVTTIEFLTTMSLLSSLIHAMHRVSGDQRLFTISTRTRHSRKLDKMTKYNKMWKAVRMCSTKAKPENNRWLPSAMSLVMMTAAGSGVLLLVGNKYYGAGTKYDELDEKLEKIVTARYDPKTPSKKYIERKQDQELKEKLRHYISENVATFMVRGESGSGKTTMIQELLKNEYKDGVLFVSITSDDLKGAPYSTSWKIREAVLDKFEECKEHPILQRKFVDFMTHANQVRMRAIEQSNRKGYFADVIKHAKQVRKWAMGEEEAHPLEAHPLIIYITLDSKQAVLSNRVMEGIATTVDGVTDDLYNSGCSTILDISQAGISDHIPSLWNHLNIHAMTEDEFLQIGRQLLAVEDPQNLVEPYLKHYHDWLGGQTKTLLELVRKDKSMHNLHCNHEKPTHCTTVESATPDTKDTILKELKTGMLFEVFCDTKTRLLHRY